MRAIWRVRSRSTSATTVVQVKAFADRRQWLAGRADRAESGLGVGVDIRWLRILRSYNTFDTAQVTSRVSYRF